jgi:DNA-binding transcriptional MerR regulator
MGAEGCGLRYLKTTEAATLLGVSPNTLRAWDLRHGFPRPLRSPGGHRLFTYSDIAALRDALQDGASVSAAVAHALETLSVHGDKLISSLVSYDLGSAEAAIETALGLRSVERAVEDVVLRALEHIADECTIDSAAWAFAAQWADGWLRRARLLAFRSEPRVSILVADASRDKLDPDAPHIRALELFCARAGIEALSLSARGVAGIGDAVAVHHPAVVVVAGGHLDDYTVARWVYAVRLAAGGAPLAVYRRSAHRVHIRPSGISVLPARAGDAQRRLLDLIAADQRRENIRRATAAPTAGAAR